MARNGTLRIGTSGYDYPHWKGVFYPEALRKREWFAFYAQHFDTVEINNTFYHLPSAETFDAWRDHAPEGFVYALKYSRYGSHMKHLADPEEHIGAFLERAERLGDHVGPILVQLPPKWNADCVRLDAFLDAAPKRLRWAVEFRNADWLRDAIYETLRGHNAALCVHDLLPEHPWIATADWRYFRFHGASGGGDYAHQVLMAAAKRIRGYLERGEDVYAYFNNDARGYAIKNAQQLTRYCTRGPKNA